MAGPTHYDILGVARDASPAAVRQAYVRRARKLHPDANTDRSPADADRRESDLRRVNDAWQVLKDKTRRRRYDEGLDPPRVSPPVASRDPGSEHEREYRYDDDREGDEDEDGILVSPMVAMLLRVGPAVLLGVVLLGLLIITSVAGGSKDDGDADSSERCVRVGSDSAVSVSCDVGNGRIVSEVNRADLCPANSLVFASDRAGVLWCVEMVS